MQSIAIAMEINPLKGIIICLIGYFFVALIGICEKSISSDTSLSVILFFQNIICFLLVVIELMPNKLKSLKTNQIGTYIIRITSGIGCYAILFYIIRYIPISEAFLYQYSASLWIPFIMLFWLNVNMEKNLWSGIIIGFIGIVIILKPNKETLGLISIAGIFCGILQAISMVAIRKLSITEPSGRILFYYFLVGTICSLLLIMTNWQLEQKDLFWLLGVGISTYLAQKFLTVSLKYANTTTLAPICYSSILFSGFFAWIFWYEIPDRWTLLGMFLVIAGCLSSSLNVHKNNRKIIM